MGLPSSGRFPLLCAASVVPTSLVEAEELLSSAEPFDPDVVEAGVLGTDVVEVTAFADVFVSFLEAFLSRAVLSAVGPPRALEICGASIAAAATKTQSQFFMLGHLYGWEDAACPRRPCVGRIANRMSLPLLRSEKHARPAKQRQSPKTTAIIIQRFTVKGEFLTVYRQGTFEAENAVARIRQALGFLRLGW